MITPDPKINALLIMPETQYRYGVLAMGSVNGRRWKMYYVYTSDDPFHVTFHVPESLSYSYDFFSRGSRYFEELHEAEEFVNTLIKAYRSET